MLYGHKTYGKTWWRSWNSDYDLFYRIFNPTDGTFITDEIRITDDEAQYIEEIQTFSDGSFEIKYTSDGQTYFYNSSGEPVGTYWEIQEDNNIHWIDLGKNLDIAIDQSDFYSASVTYYVGGGNSGIQWNNSIQKHQPRLILRPYLMEI